MYELTKKQKKVLEFIKHFIGDHGYPPTMREIVAHFKFKSINAVTNHLKALVKKECIKRNSWSARSIEVRGFSPGRSTRLVPLIGEIRAGLPELAVESTEDYISLDRSIAKSDDEFLLKIKGDSMIDAHIQDGDYALIRPQKTAHNGDIVAALIENEDATLKYFYKRKNHIELVAANPSYPPLILNRENSISIIGKVITIIRKYED